ncbi:hypothetical protein GCM10007385_13370 [Tateyamaria omphalii]|uniref:hypothetical protein n=1 Tax=Tateyamaria omphalii TaxID=299262 RepID=UPI00167BDC13|nr:hypothetical protein [Tateyamaria omphalii]GGX46975.1 hypothetical protein GCM10007385_13370 [Tateyamaria omphalii]
MKTIVCVTAACVAIAGPVWADSIVPTDMAPTCVVAPDTFKGWFADDTIAANAAVNAPDSVTFTTTYGDPDKCDFYTWGAQMFLWLTSTDGTKLVLDSPNFFTIAPADSDGNRVFIENTDSTPAALQVRSEKADTPAGDDIGEIGQAGSSGVLMSQDNSLVYYGLAANDAYAYFLTGQKDPNSTLASKTTFPYNQTDLDDLNAYMSTSWSGTTLLTGNQLAMELKTSWVEASTLADSSTYLTIEGTIPNFVANDDNSSMSVDTTNPTKTVALALTGMHVVGTVQDHPEFVWATFEHYNNAPDAPYYYLADDGTITLNDFDSDHDFLFMARNGTQAGANTECMKAKSDGTIAVQINSTGGFMCNGGIVPSNTVREYPWGSLANDPSSATVSNNTLLLSINNSVRSQLAAGDIRANYIQTGSVWTTTPSDGSVAPIPNQTANQALNLRGSTSIANMTMETYTQGTNCFSCHSLSEGAPNSFQAFGLSHVYSQIEPLQPAN